MKRITHAYILAALMALTLGLAFAQDDTDSTEIDVAITDANFIATSPEKENLNDEWIMIANDGDGDVSLEGWTLSDQQNHVYNFQDFVLLSGASVKVHSGSGDDTEEDLYWNRSSPVWNNDGDTATLTDDGGYVVSRYPEESTGA
jgi:competence protein ComEC